MTKQPQPTAETADDSSSAPANVEDQSSEYIDDEIVSLLNQAESLTEELATEFDGEFDDGAETVGLHPQETSVDAPSAHQKTVTNSDPSSELQPVEESILETSASSMPRAEPTLVVESAKATGPVLSDLLNDPDAVAEEVVEASTDRAPEPARIQRKVGVELATPQHVGEESTGSMATETETDGDAAIEETTEAQTSPQGEIAEVQASVEEKLPFKARAFSILGKLMSILRGALRGILRLPRLVIAVPVHLLVIADKPFARVGSRPRRVIGIIALATTLCAVLAWLLPWLLTTNPFANMPMGIVTDH